MKLLISFLMLLPLAAQTPPAAPAQPPCSSAAADAKPADAKPADAAPPAEADQDRRARGLACSHR